MFTNAVWVDIDMACGQCHGGSFGKTATHNGAPYFTKAGLAAGAANMHHIAAAPVAPVVSSAALTTTGYQVSFTDTSTDADDSGNTDVVAVNWGDGATSTGARGGSLHPHLTRVRG